MQIQIHGENLGEFEIITLNRKRKSDIKQLGILDIITLLCDYKKIKSVSNWLGKARVPIRKGY